MPERINDTRRQLTPPVPLDCDGASGHASAGDLLTGDVAERVVREFVGDLPLGVTWLQPDARGAALRAVPVLVRRAHDVHPARQCVAGGQFHGLRPTDTPVR